jgi:hypothetical protein
MQRFEYRDRDPYAPTQCNHSAVAREILTVTGLANGDCPNGNGLSAGLDGRPVKVRLDRIVIDLERDCHGDPSALSEKALTALMYAIPFEKDRVRVKGYFEGPWFIPLTGHRRVMATRFPAARRVPNYADDMEIDAIVIEGNSVR